MNALVTGAAGFIGSHLSDALLDQAGNRAPIEIDGGIDLSNIARVVEAGVEIVVSGSAIFDTPDPSAATAALKRAANS